MAHNDGMDIKTCKYIAASDLFQGFNLALNVFINSDPQCTWGDNIHSMVDPDVVIDALENSDLNKDEEHQVRLVLKRLRKLEKGVYVDLEN